MERINPKSDSYSALMWDIVCNAQRYSPRWGHKVLDLGAHFGMFSLFCASRGCDVTAIEPDPKTFLELMHSCEVAKEIGQGEITPIRAAVCGTAGERAFWRHPETSGSNSLIQKKGMLDQIPYLTQIYVPAITLKSALGETNWNCVKVDIEGSEYEAFITADSHDFAKINYLTMEIHNDILSLANRNELIERLKAEFPDFDAIPVMVNGRATSDLVSIMCWR